MVYYMCSNKNHQVILSTLKENGVLIIDSFVHDHISFKKFVKSNITQLSVEILIFDISAFDDSDDDILSAIQMIRTMYENTKIIIIAHNRIAGNKLLADIFSLGILNIIATYDFLQIKTELNTCLNEGKTFKEALVFKDIKDEILSNTVIELKTASKVSIAIIGVQRRIGVTHNAIILATTIRKMGYMVAIVEMNNSSDFQKIRASYDTKMHDNYFVLDGVDYYPDATKDTLKYIKSEKSYNFIVLDYGDYREQDISEVVKSNVKIAICGSKVWEYQNITELISLYDDETLKNIFFGFIFTDKKNEKSIKKEMHIPTGKNKKESLNTFFIPYAPDTFNTYIFPNINIILKDYLPENKHTKIKKKKILGLF
jgi:hypothetical protein